MRIESCLINIYRYRPFSPYRIQFIRMCNPTYFLAVLQKKITLTDTILKCKYSQNNNALISFRISVGPVNSRAVKSCGAVGRAYSRCRPACHWPPAPPPARATATRPHAQRRLTHHIKPTPSFPSLMECSQKIITK